MGHALSRNACRRSMQLKSQFSIRIPAIVYDASSRPTNHSPHLVLSIQMTSAGIECQHHQPSKSTCCCYNHRNPTAAALPADSNAGAQSQRRPIAQGKPTRTTAVAAALRCLPYSEICMAAAIAVKTRSSIDSCTCRGEPWPALSTSPEEGHRAGRSGTRWCGVVLFDCSHQPHVVQAARKRAVTASGQPCICMAA